ncbi:Protein of unknown function [Colwellia chukchiensis]|uniref:DUF1653 domain-containing protein n=1 Tax=Colwellia chukchiensis TaxID=641665 RepID=A0A1H7KJC9_9GAMM|nr:DUF1653 domain-containing protein [Colwellia chukchiensis]SEK87003.1 Protein of unknown function [Colwellia chukchiensis]
MLKTGRYQHFKGNYYQVLHIAKHSETEELMVVYQPEYGDRAIWVRPLAMFDETIERDGKVIKRFKYVCDNNSPHKQLI